MDETYWDSKELDHMKVVIISMNSLFWQGCPIESLTDSYETVLKMQFGEVWELK